MTRNGRFKGRSVGVVGDLSIDEQRYLYAKARELKAELAAGGDAARFRISDPDYSAYMIFLENSTRTRESFRNAALFHRVRATMFDAATSSFAKNESLTDAIKMLVGYAPRVVLRHTLKARGRLLLARRLPGALGRALRLPAA